MEMHVPDQKANPKHPQQIVLRISLTRATALLILLLICTLAVLTYSLQPARTPTRPEHTPTPLWHLVPNGNFESEDMWPNQTNSKGKFVRSTDLAYDGIYSAKTVTLNHNEGYAHISNPISTEIGKSYILSAYFHTQNMPNGNLSVDLADTHSTRINATPGQTGWQLRYAHFTANDKSVRIRIICDGHVRSTETGYIDCIAFTPAAEFKP